MANSSIRSYLQEEFVLPIRDPLWRHIYLSKGLKSIVACAPFQKLNGIKQLGPAYLAYPGATHTRFSHSLGVFEIAKRTVTSLLQHRAEEIVTLEGLKAFLSAALLHDLGHFPFAHSLKDLALQEHEQLTGELILSTKLKDIISCEVGTSPELTAAVIDLHMDSEGREELTLYRHLLSGVLDPDKLDYLNRDAFFCGVPYGMQDIDFVLSKLRFRRDIGIYLERDGVNAVENVLFSKYLMYRTVYWHRSVRAATAMIKKAVLSAIGEGVIRPSDLYGLDDDDFRRRFTAADYRPFRLIEAVSARRLHALAYEEAVPPPTPDLSGVEDPSSRAELESELTRAIASRVSDPPAPGDVIVDIPEPISFESDLLIETGDRFVPFPESGTVFDSAVVSGFSQSLRKLRVFLDPGILRNGDKVSALIAEVIGSSVSFSQKP